MARPARFLPAALLLASALAGGGGRPAQSLPPPEIRAPVRELAVVFIDTLLYVAIYAITAVGLFSAISPSPWGMEPSSSSQGKIWGSSGAVPM